MNQISFLNRGYAFKGLLAVLIKNAIFRVSLKKKYCQKGTQSQVHKKIPKKTAATLSRLPNS